jgi:4-hydroxythreonine-4-phosphate dehydrogenase
MGDPCGCGPQITAKAWQMRESIGLSPFFVIADPSVFDGLCKTHIVTSPKQAEIVFNKGLPVLPLSARLPTRRSIGTPDKAFAPTIIESIETATNLALKGHVAGMVTNPISKAVLYAAGFQHPGHTEYIASLCTQNSGDQIKPIMMLVGGGLRVALATIHIPLMQVADHLTQNGLIKIGRIVNAAMQTDFGILNPRIAFTGLNPHAGEDGTIGREEIDIIDPAAETLRAEGVNISNARPGDTVFHEALQGQYDTVIAMSHDQGLIPVKTLDMWGGVNTTLGLPIIRTSPDHGTAYDAAATGTARPDSLIAALKLATDMAANRAKTTP